MPCRPAGWDGIFFLCVRTRINSRGFSLVDLELRWIRRLVLETWILLCAFSKLYVECYEVVRRELSIGSESDIICAGDPLGMDTVLRCTTGLLR